MADVLPRRSCGPQILGGQRAAVGIEKPLRAVEHRLQLCHPELERWLDVCVLSGLHHASPSSRNSALAPYRWSWPRSMPGPWRPDK